MSFRSVFPDVVIAFALVIGACTLYGAPPMAPLLFPNLTVLGLIGLWQLRTSNEPDPG